MVLAVGCVHPAGEAAGYDGLYFRDNEMSALASKLSGLPLCVEHLDDKPVGHVAHAWVAQDRRCYALFETTDDSFGGILAGRMVEHELTPELSLGHTCTIEQSSDAMAVVSKQPTEVSICAKGARDGTQIVGRTGRLNYIRVGKSLSSVRPQMADAPSQNEPNPAGTVAPTSNDMMTQLLEQVKQLSEAHALTTKKNEHLQAQYDEASAKVEQVELAGKRKREQAVDGTIKDFFTNLMAKYETELKPHEAELGSIVESMKENANSTPMVEAIACAAAQHAKSTVELEAAYQEIKRLKTNKNEQDAQLANANSTMFGKPSERMQVAAVASAGATTAAASRHSSIFAAGAAKTVGASRGMKELNPGLWDDLCRSSTRSTGMPTVEEFLKLKK